MTLTITNDIIFGLLLYVFVFIITITIIIITSNRKKKKAKNNNKISSTIINILLGLKDSEISIIKENKKNIKIIFKINSESIENNKKLEIYINEEFNKLKINSYKNIFKTLDIEINNNSNIISGNIKIEFIDENFYEKTLLKELNK